MTTLQRLKQLAGLPSDAPTPQHQRLTEAVDDLAHHLADEGELFARLNTDLQQLIQMCQQRLASEDVKGTVMEVQYEWMMHKAAGLLDSLAKHSEEY